MWTFLPLISLITSPACMPCSAAEYPSLTPLISGERYPTERMMITQKIHARIRLNAGPAAMTEILAHTDLLLKLPSDISSASSSPIMQAPPKGSSLMQNFVPPIFFPISVGPRPKENSSTRIPFAFARRKCPSS